LSRRPRSGGRRLTARQRRKERKQSMPDQAVPSPTLASREPSEAPRHADVAAGGSSAATTSAKPAARHIAKDYSYVFGELRRIAIIVLAIVAGLVAAAVALR
jgi:hypothetical protein